MNPSLISPAVKLHVLKDVLPELCQPIVQPGILDTIQKANPALLSKAGEPDLLGTIDLALNELKRDPAKYPNIGQFLAKTRQHNPNLVISSSKPKGEQLEQLRDQLKKQSPETLRTIRDEIDAIDPALLKLPQVESKLAAVVNQLDPLANAGTVNTIFNAVL